MCNLRPLTGLSNPQFLCLGKSEAPYLLSEVFSSDEIFRVALVVWHTKPLQSEELSSVRRCAPHQQGELWADCICLSEGQLPSR